MDDGDDSDKSISIDIYKDELVEGTERFALDFSNATGGADINFNNRVSFSIEDVPRKSGRIRIKNRDITVKENSSDATITVERLDGAAGKVSINYSTGTNDDTAERQRL